MNNRPPPTNRLLASILALGMAGWAPQPALAGSVDGPYLAWFNLANDASADAAIHAYTNAETYYDSCWNDNAILQVSKLPQGLTADLVRRAVVRREAKAQIELRQILKHPKGGVDLEGYDGVIVIPTNGQPRMISFAASGRIKTSIALSPTGEKTWEASFCEVLPPISRKP